MTTTVPEQRTLLRRLHDRLPTTVDRRVRIAAWASLVAQIAIVGTGGAVRLTGSGLGCPTWPRCTVDSFVATPEMGIHGVIEFGNRLLTFVLVAIAIVTFLFVLRLRRDRPELFGLALALGLGIPFQGVLGGLTVLSNLNPWIVGLHFIPSVVLVSLATVLVYRVMQGPRGDTATAPRWYIVLAHVASALVAITVLVGILTTGSGPHAGDHGAARNGLDSALLQHVHSWPAYAAFAAVALLVLASLPGRIRTPRPFVLGLLGVMLVQIVVGVTQARLGLPELLVGMHMVLAVCTVSLTTASVLSLRK
ncbi:cytochrome c oxidase assembly protein subunit 15 [Diaminobutyricimonas aerilata]|uniref:Cytochrome c oxidase assembly protein subunit 15 n=1 Tax=Diaminobutyricimonas aerilata TaxID=1162967 RepID=A0A2M9CJZ3_9MICO|nr:COX15/CtaA family protein [Diaminobutyricimonas aerilata]PJJ72216.1 cytochrome c oxidase assembly protein subunit 15 [Diaminobutyricimonas aerilata]